MREPSELVNLDLDENELVLVLSMRCIFMVQSVVASVLKNLEDAAHR